MIRYEAGTVLLRWTNCELGWVEAMRWESANDAGKKLPMSVEVVERHQAWRAYLKRPGEYKVQV